MASAQRGTEAVENIVDAVDKGMNNIYKFKEARLRKIFRSCLIDHTSSDRFQTRLSKITKN